MMNISKGLFTLFTVVFDDLLTTDVNSILFIFSFSISRQYFIESSIITSIL